MPHFFLPQIWTRHTILTGIRAGSPNKNISECLGIKLRTVQRIRKETGESNYEGTAARETHSARSDEKKTSEFVSEIKTMTDNDPSKSMRAIARETGVSELLIRQTVHEHIRYISYIRCTRANMTLYHVTQAENPRMGVRQFQRPNYSRHITN